MSAIAERPGRRDVLKLMAAAFATGSLAACEQAENIVPYVRQPEDVIPGRPLHYATALAVDGFGFGAVVESHEGRPTKIEGNPDHPASLGATDAIMQAACFGLYDPSRSRTPMHRGEPAGWNDFLGMIAQLRTGLERDRGAGFAILAGMITSPSVAWLIERLRSGFPELAYCKHDPLDAIGEESALAGPAHRRLRSINHIERAQVILSLDADFLGEGPQRLADARGFAGRRVLRAGATAMSRLYVVESMGTITGASADHRWGVRPSRIADAARDVAAKLSLTTSAGSEMAPAVLDAIVEDLRSAGRNALVLAGPHQPPAVHHWARAINARLGASGNTVEYIDAPDYVPDNAFGISELTGRINRRQVSSLLILGGNPAYATAGELDFASALSNVPLSIHWGLHQDATAARCTWHVPAAHDLERWGDIRAFDGTASIVQPLIKPLYGGRTAEEILGALLGEYDRTPLDFVRTYWRSEGGLDDTAWNQAVQRGIVTGTRHPPVALPPPPQPFADAAVKPGEGLEVRFAPDPWLRAGEHAANTWLQELPRPLSKLVWGNAATISAQDAADLGVTSGDRLTLRHNENSLSLPAWIDASQPQGAMTLLLGFGQGGIGDTGTYLGSDCFPLRSANEPWILTGVDATPAGEQASLITTQKHHALEGRDILRLRTLASYLAEPDLQHGAQPDVSLYPEWQYPDEAWGMAIDLTACIGCTACVAACQAENNTPAVGAAECASGHEMHWLRVDRYDVEGGRTAFQPVPCMHCENAPCEAVCPVNATVHTHDGLNAQVYNRCVGTRYCSQNCPYKVRRFNFLSYQPFDEDPESPLAELMNPNVSVRSRGVMEKCTYCIQRIEAARIEARVAGRKIRDGEIRTACQQACPASAIVFGDLNDPESELRKWRDHPLNYTLLAELNTRPRTTYLARVVNPNPRLENQEAASG